MMKLQKETNPHGRWYGDACAAAFAMELIGERWSMLIARELMLGGLRFSDLRAVLPGISAKVLTERLGALEGAGILRRCRDGTGVNVQIYELTEWGRGLEDVMQALGRWAVRSPRHNPTLPLTPVALMLSLRTMLDVQAAKGLELSVLFNVGDRVFSGQLSQGELNISRGRSESAAFDLIFHAEAPLDYLRVFYGDAPVGAAATGLKVDGDVELARRFAGCFALPTKMPVGEADGTA
jgi:DNA-binding HxlR family transcriptional regulator